jgi:hypothetical protein
MDIDNIPYVLQIDTNLCDAVETNELDITIDTDLSTLS